MLGSPHLKPVSRLLYLFRSSLHWFDLAKIKVTSTNPFCLRNAYVSFPSQRALCPRVPFPKVSWPPTRLETKFNRHKHLGAGPHHALLSCAGPHTCPKRVIGGRFQGFPNGCPTLLGRSIGLVILPRIPCTSAPQSSTERQTLLFTETKQASGWTWWRVWSGGSIPTPGLLAHVGHHTTLCDTDQDFLRKGNTIQNTTPPMMTAGLWRSVWPQKQPVPAKAYKPHSTVPLECSRDTVLHSASPPKGRKDPHHTHTHIQA